MSRNAEEANVFILHRNTKKPRLRQFYGDVIGPALRVQRRRHNLTHQHRGMILFDKCPAHLDRRFAKAREQFSESLNVELFGDTGIETPTPDVLPFTLGHITNAIWKQATK